MKNLKNAISLIVLLTLFSCASTMPMNQRSFVVKQKTDKSYSDLMYNITQSFENSGKVIQFQDEKLKTITIRANTDCNVLKQWGDINDYLLQFTAKITVKDNEMTLRFDNMYISHLTGNAVSWGNNQINSTKKLNKSKKCLKTLIDGFIK